MYSHTAPGKCPRPTASPASPHISSEIAVTAFGDTRPINSRSAGPSSQTKKLAKNFPNSWLCFTPETFGG